MGRKKAAGGAALAAFALLGGCQKPAAAPDAPTPVAADPAAPVTPGMRAPVAVAAPDAPATSLGQSMNAKSKVKLDIVSATRSGGVLTVAVRLTLAAGKPGGRPLPGGGATGVYVTAADKKYLLLKDDGDHPLMSSETYPNLERIGATSMWWGKFPAPPPEVKAVNVFFGDFMPIENVALTDR